MTGVQTCALPISIVAFIQSQGAKAGIQLAHSGRKGSTLAPWLDASTMSPNVETCIAATGEANGWEDVWAPSAIPFAEDKYPTPVAMTLEHIDELKEAWRAAVVRSDEAGFDVVELHLAHGYLVSLPLHDEIQKLALTLVGAPPLAQLHNFLSPLSNHRTDKYGGSLCAIRLASHIPG